MGSRSSAHLVAAGSFIALALAFAALVGCAPSSPNNAGVEPEVKDLAIKLERDIDLLFLIDDSPSMTDKQTNLAASFAAFIDVLTTVHGGLPNLHVAVVTSDLGSSAADGTVGPAIGTLGQGGCGGTGKNADMQLFGVPVTAGRFLSDVALPDGTRQRNYSGELVQAFQTMAKAGAGGCGFEQHLEAIKRALDPAHVANQGFLRPSALLAVIVFADEDDCSLSTPALLGSDPTTLGPLQSFRCTRFGVVCDDQGATPDAMNQVGAKTACHPAADTTYLTGVTAYADSLKRLKPDPSQVIVAALAGDLDPFAVELRAPPGSPTKIPALAHACTYLGARGTPEVADPAVRIRSLLDQFPTNAFATICQLDLTAAVRHVAGLLRPVIGDPCIAGKLADVDPTTAGTQTGCAVSVVTSPGTPLEHRADLPACTPAQAAATNPPCWRVAADPAICPSGDHARLVIDGQAELANDAHVIASCTVEKP